jgi:hypothetical protein
LDWWVSGVKRMTLNLLVAIVSFLLLAYKANAARSALRAAVRVSRSGEDSPLVKLSAKEAVSWDWGGSQIQRS